VLPLLQKLAPNFQNDVIVFNTGWAGCCAALHGSLVLPLLLSVAGSRLQPQQGAATAGTSAAGKLVSQFCHCCRCWHCCRLHYETPGEKGKPVNESKLVTELAALATWRQQHKANLPQLVWMDAPVQVRVCAGWPGSTHCSEAPAHVGCLADTTWLARSAHCSLAHAAVAPVCASPALHCSLRWLPSLQHFSGPDGSYDGGQKPFKCRPLEAWGKGDPVVRAGGRRNIPLAPIIPQLADAHLRTWNDSVPLWNTHKPDECTHWCSPSAYHMWLYKLNDVLRDSGLGNAVLAPDRPPPAAAAAVGD
jgi:hypothetical protein